MTVVRREPPTSHGRMSSRQRSQWLLRGLDDLASGKHAVECECETADDCDCSVCGPKPVRHTNACLTIAKALRDFVAYEIEEP